MNSDVDPPNPALFALAQVPLAQKHGQSQRISVPTDSPELCECCHCPISTKQYRMSVDTEELSHLGLAFPLLFYMQRCRAAMLGVVVIVTVLGILFQMLLSIDPSALQTTYQEEIAKATKSLVQKVGGTRIFVAILYAPLILMCVLFCRITVTSRKVLKRLKEKERSPAEFALVVKNLGSGWQPQQLKEYLETYILEYAHTSVEIVNINVAYDLRHYFQALKQIKAKTIDMNAINTNRHAGESCLCCCGNGRVIEDEEAVQSEIEQATADLENVVNSSVQAGVAFVSFANAKQARVANLWLKQNIITETFLSIFALGHNLRFNNRILEVKQANAPSDINWLNLHKSQTQLLIRRVVSWSVLGALLLANYYTLKALGQWLDDLKKADDGGELRISSTVKTVVVLILNTLLEVTVRKLAAFESHHSYSGQSLSSSRKLTIALSLNTLIFPLMVYKMDQYELVNGSLGYDPTKVAISAMFAKPLLRFFDPAVILKWWKRRRIISALKGERVFVSQHAANQAFEPPEIDIVECYSDIMLRFILAIAYSPLTQFIIPVTLVGVLLDYLITKWVLLKRAKHPRQLSEKLFQNMSFFVKVSILLCVYLIYFQYAEDYFEVKDYVKWATHLFLAFVLGHWLVFAYLIKDKSGDQGLERSYEAEKKNFRSVEATQTYASKNPITRLSAHHPSEEASLLIQQRATYVGEALAIGEEREKEKSDYRLREQSLRSFDTLLLSDLPNNTALKPDS